jgi:hypothetical protein
MTRQEQIAAVAAALVHLEGWIPANHRIKSKAEVADEHAWIIEGAMNEITGKSRGGPMRELRDLSAAARKAIARKDVAGWAHAWAEVSRRTRWLVWQDHSTMPDAETALREIAFAVKRLSSVPLSKRRRRTRVAAEQDAIGSIKLAFWELSDRRPRRIIGRDGQITGPLVAFCREIDRIFGTRLFSGADCWRLR